MNTKHVLGETTVRMGLAALAASCPKFNEDLPAHVPSPVGVEMFEISRAAVKRTAPVLKKEDMNNLFSLRNESGFPCLLYSVTDCISGHSVADYEAWQHMKGVEERNSEKRQIIAFQ
jgi:hypothetical protein